MAVQAFHFMKEAFMPARPAQLMAAKLWLTRKEHKAHLNL